MQAQQGFHTGKDANITPSYSSLPFMEIREEFDQYGNEIKSEVMNMSKVVQNVKREIESKKESGETKSNEMLEALLQSIPSSTDLYTKSSGSSSSSYNSGNQQATHHLERKTKSSSSYLDHPNDPTTDDNPHEIEKTYQPSRTRLDISARLDELIRLEEEAERRKQVNAKSSKKIQGSGWKKGFLSTKKHPSSKKQEPTLESLSSSKSFLKNKQETVGKVKKVQFTESNDVKEIPRMTGTRPNSKSMNTTFPSLLENKVTGIEQSLSTQDSVTMNHTLLQTRTTDDETPCSRPSQMVSMGGIIERMEKTSISDRTSNNIPSKKSEDHPAMASDSKKKLSKFAQRRRQQDHPF